MKKIVMEMNNAFNRFVSGQDIAKEPRNKSVCLKVV